RGQMNAQLTRRQILGGAAMLSAWSPSRVLGANDRVVIGCIGLGGMGSGHLGSLVKRGAQENIQVGAVCDVYQKRLDEAMDISKAPGFVDYRRLLERKDIDAVLIATPDHWHGKLTIDALEAGKHVYCEKPMTHTVEQAIQVRNTAKRYPRQVVQIGVQGTSSPRTWKTRELIQGGRIGKVTWAQGSYNRNARVCLFNQNGQAYLIDPAAGPSAKGADHIDWDMWLGHQFGLAPKIPYNPEHFFRFRKYWAYSGGVATDLLYHKLAPLLIGITGPNGEYPRRVNSSGGLYIEKDGRDIPDVFMMNADYASEFSVFLTSTLTNDTQLPDRIYGKYGTLEMESDDSVSLKANGDFTPEFSARNGDQKAVEVKQPKGDGFDHKTNFLNAIRHGEKVNCNVDVACATMVAIKLAVDSYRTSKTMTWDSASERVVGA
ncbi:MAG: Gfo/Idh/MocA family oxidoreductase, partial [Bryobacteraceae bacterium]